MSGGLYYLAVIIIIYLFCQFDARVDAISLLNAYNRLVEKENLKENDSDFFDLHPVATVDGEDVSVFYWVLGQDNRNS